jgi:hypothetical protein
LLTARKTEAPRLPPERIAAMARDLVDGGRDTDVLAVARKLLASAERRRRTHPAVAADRAALAMALLAELRRRWTGDRVTAAPANEEGIRVWPK